MKKVLPILMLMLLCIVAMIAGGCVEQAKKPLYGNGELPAHWIAMFGDDNVARVDYVQAQMLDQVRANIYGIDQKDESGKVIHKRGIIERIMALEDKVTEMNKKPEAVAIVEPNEVTDLMGK